MSARQGPGGSGLAVDVSNWLRPGAVTSPERTFCYVYGRDKGQAQRISGLAVFFAALASQHVGNDPYDRGLCW